MRERRFVSGLAVAALLVPSMAACLRRGQLVYVLPEGYVGPVVIVYDVPGRVKPAGDYDTTLSYVIPPNGILRIDGQPPRSAVYDIRVYYGHDDGSLKSIPVSDGPTAAQAFGWETGTGGTTPDNAAVHWTTFVVGVPNERADWLARRDEAVARATGIPQHPL